MRLNAIFQRLKNGMYRDFILSIIASGITTVMAQVITYPLLARLFSVEDYGKILTMMGVSSVITLAFGNSLNNVRLVLNTEYEEKGDFLPLLTFFCVLGALVYGIYLIVFGIKSVVVVLILCGFVLFGVMQNYGSVAFRIKIDYKKNLILNVFIAVGNAVGLIILYLTKSLSLWGLTFLGGQLLGVIYIWNRSSIFREPYRFTPLFSRMIKKESVLLFSTLCANILVYLDRLFLYPLLGGEAVSTYTVASFFGKSLAILMNPISGVLLSYYAQKNYEMNRKRFWHSNIITMGLGMLFMLFSIVASKPITGVLYPSIIEDATPYLFIANLAAVVNVIGNMAQPAVLKYASTKWIAINQVAYMVVYLGCGILLSRRNGLMGFSYAVLIAAFTRMAIFFAVGHISIKKDETGTC